MLRAHFGRASSSLPTWLDEVDCSGDEERLSDCSGKMWGDEDCGHSEDAGVICYTSKFLFHNMKSNCCISSLFLRITYTSKIKYFYFQTQEQRPCPRDAQIV